MNKLYFPEKTAVSVEITKLLKTADTRPLGDRMSTRMVKCASVLDEGEQIGWQMRVPAKGLAAMALFGSKAFCADDLAWILEKTGKAADCVSAKGPENYADSALDKLYEICLPIAEEPENGGSIGFGGSLSGAEGGLMKWPYEFALSFAELLRVLQSAGGGELRAVIGSAGIEEQLRCRKILLADFPLEPIPAQAYLGSPVRLRVLLRLSTDPSIRLKTVIEGSIQGSRIRFLGSLSEYRAASLWEHPLRGAAVLPAIAAGILLMEPEAKGTIVGVETLKAGPCDLPASHKNPDDPGAILLGRAADISGETRQITVSAADLRRHYQILGQTGTGKSTLLSTLILSAIRQGHGLTFFDPHGNTIEELLQSLPKRYANRVRVMHLADADNPVPINLWDSDDPAKEEKTISDLCELLEDIFDPRGEGFLGPRWERWFSTFAKASIAFLGRQASLESIAVLSQSQENMLKLSQAICKRNHELVETIRQEYGTDKSTDFQNILNWYLCKFQRLTSVEQLRKTLGAGDNALDFAHTIDTETVTLIDLGSPEIGSQAARVAGTLILMKLWNAVLGRKNREKTHLVVVDEASLFQTNPMPKMLAEGRKFGLSVVFCHQHLGQLTGTVRSALEANSANFSAFRLSAQDAVNAAIRFDDPALQVHLTRLDAFQAVTSISVEGRQTTPFTLKTERPKKQENGEEIAAQIEERSIQTLVDPYRDKRALTRTEIQRLLDRPRCYEEWRKAQLFGSRPSDEEQTRIAV